MEYGGRNNSLLDNDDNDSDSESSGAGISDNHVGLNELADEDAMNSLADQSLDGHDSFLAVYVRAASSSKATSYSIESPAGDSQFDSLVAAAIESPAADSQYDSLVAAATPATKLRGLSKMNSNVVPSEHNMRSKCNDHGSKRQKTEDAISHWEQDYCDIGAERKGLTLEVVLAMKIRQYIWVMWNYDTTDINDIRNFSPAFLRKVSNDKYEVMDDRDYICFAELLVDGDDGLANLWGTYLKPPTKDFIDYVEGTDFSMVGTTGQLTVKTLDTKSHPDANWQEILWLKI
jgi:hypothetical protein